MQRLHWGILGTGNIARQFAAGVADAKRSRIVAVGSRTQRTAVDFAAMFDLPHAYGSYEQLLADDGVDAIYLSLPNSMHHEWTLAALRAGKHVLCEKPMASTAAQAEEMFDAARQHDRLLVEAFMYRSHPLIHSILKDIRAGAIGKLHLIRTSFCYRTMRIDDNIRFSRELAGGALMDVGCYCLSLMRLLCDSEPETVLATGHLHETGVDDRMIASLQFPGGILASMICGMTVQTNNAAWICGDQGYIEIPVPWKPPVNKARYIVSGMTPPRQDAGPKKAPPPRVVEVDAHLPLYALEADDFAAAVLDGQAPAVSRDDSIGNMRLLDTIRDQIGVRWNG